MIGLACIGLDGVMPSGKRRVYTITLMWNRASRDRPVTTALTPLNRSANVISHSAQRERVLLYYLHDVVPDPDFPFPATFFQLLHVL